MAVRSDPAPDRYGLPDGWRWMIDDDPADDGATAQADDPDNPGRTVEVYIAGDDEYSEDVLTFSGVGLTRDNGDYAVAPLSVVAAALRREGWTVEPPEPKL